MEDIHHIKLVYRMVWEEPSENEYQRFIERLKDGEEIQQLYLQSFY